MALVGKARFIPIRIADLNSNPVTNRTLADLDVILLRNAEPCTDAVNLINIGDGLYFVSYTPSAVGDDYLEVYDQFYDLRFMDTETVDGLSSGGGLDQGDVVNLTQDYDGVGALKADVADPSSYTLYVFNSQDWVAGYRTGLTALASTAIDASGNWLLSPLPLVPGTYHLVLMNNQGATHVLRAFLTV